MNKNGLKKSWQSTAGVLFGFPIVTGFKDLLKARFQQKIVRRTKFHVIQAFMYLKLVT